MNKEIKKGTNTLNVVENKTISPKQNPNMLPLKNPNKGKISIKTTIVYHF